MWDICQPWRKHRHLSEVEIRRYLLQLVCSQYFVLCMRLSTIIIMRPLEPLEEHSIISTTIPNPQGKTHCTQFSTELTSFTIASIRSECTASHSVSNLNTTSAWCLKMPLCMRLKLLSHSWRISCAGCNNTEQYSNGSTVLHDGLMWWDRCSHWCKGWE